MSEGISHQMRALHIQRPAADAFILKQREEKERHVIHYEMCLPDQEKAHAEKVVLLMGAEGSGMKTLLDLLATFLCSYSEEKYVWSRFQNQHISGNANNSVHISEEKGITISFCAHDSDGSCIWL